VREERDIFFAELERKLGTASGQTDSVSGTSVAFITRVAAAMVDKIHIQEMEGRTVSDAGVEIVERKGLGHPDTICDLVMEKISQRRRQFLGSAVFGADAAA
jgi:hypothetical protein